MTWFDRRLEEGAFRMMLAEELLIGRQVTFEGYMLDGSLTPVGVADSVMHENGISFLRFTTRPPSPELQRRMAEIAERFMRAIEFDRSLFNMEFFVGPDGDLKIIEVNGRMASQFGPLVKAVHGVSTYEVGLDLARGGSRSCRRPATTSWRPASCSGRTRTPWSRTCRTRPGCWSGSRTHRSSCWCGPGSACRRTTTT